MFERGKIMKDKKCKVQINISGGGKAVGTYLEEIGKSIKKAYKKDKEKKGDKN